MSIPIEVLRDAFGDAPVSDVAPLSGGMSGALVWSLTAEGERWVVRQTSGRWPNELPCWEIAGARGVAPEVRHIDWARNIIVMRHVDGAMMGRGGYHTREESVTRVARLLRNLHDGPAFPNGLSRIAGCDLIDGVLAAQGAPLLPRSIRAVFERFVPVVARFPSAPCHNDVNPNNLIENAERTHLVDWETACQGDPYFDLALLGIFGAPSDALRALVLRSYLDREPTALEEAHALVARVLGLGHYGGAFSFVTSLRRMPHEDVSLSLDEVVAFMRGHAQMPAPPVVAAALLAEMQRLADSAEVAAAVALIAAA